MITKHLNRNSLKISFFVYLGALCAQALIIVRVQLAYGMFLLFFSDGSISSEDPRLLIASLAVGAVALVAYFIFILSILKLYKDKMSAWLIVAFFCMGIVSVVPMMHFIAGFIFLGLDYSSIAIAFVVKWFGSGVFFCTLLMWTLAKALSSKAKKSFWFVIVWNITCMVLLIVTIYWREPLFIRGWDIFSLGSFISYRQITLATILVLIDQAVMGLMLAFAFGIFPQKRAAEKAVRSIKVEGKKLKRLFDTARQKSSQQKTQEQKELRRRDRKEFADRESWSTFNLDDER